MLTLAAAFFEDAECLHQGWWETFSWVADIKVLERRWVDSIAKPTKEGGAEDF
jgi:hypothetical protein